MKLLLRSMICITVFTLSFISRSALFRSTSGLKSRIDPEKRRIADNYYMYSYFVTKTLFENMLLMSTHNIHFCGEIGKIFVSALPRNIVQGPVVQS